MDRYPLAFGYGKLREDKNLPENHKPYPKANRPGVTVEGTGRNPQAKQTKLTDPELIRKLRIERITRTKTMSTKKERLGRRTLISRKVVNALQ